MALTITLTDDDDNTILSGDIIDQAALHGCLRKGCNLGLTIISVNPQTKRRINHKTKINALHPVTRDLTYIIQHKELKDEFTQKCC